MELAMKLVKFEKALLSVRCKFELAFETATGPDRVL